MEWPADFSYTPMDESLYGLLSSSLESDAQKIVWTAEENDLFENALIEFSPSSPAFIESVAARVPWKSIEDVKSHYHALLDDINLIETGKVPLPHYPDDKEDDQVNDQPKVDEGSTSNNPKAKSQRRRAVPWTDNEHHLFLMGLNKYGKGDWRSISRFYVITKTPTQVASHSQKYFRRQTSSTPADRRRPSIHDIQAVSPTAFNPIPPRASTLPTASDQPLPNFPSYGNVYQTQPQLNHCMINSGGDGYDPNSMFYPTMNNNNSFSMMNNMNPTIMNNMNPAGFDPFFSQNVNVDFNGMSANVNQGYLAPEYMMDPSMISQQHWGFD